jgi:hypothetical protein
LVTGVRAYRNRRREREHSEVQGGGAAAAAMASPFWQRAHELRQQKAQAAAQGAVLARWLRRLLLAVLLLVLAGAVALLVSVLDVMPALTPAPPSVPVPVPAQARATEAEALPGTTACDGCYASALAAGWPAGVPLPSFFILGARKGGTTSLFRYLAQHPHVRAPAAKELHFFDMHYDRGYAWYARQFVVEAATGTQGDDDVAAITGEASVGYLASCVAPARLRRAVPNARLWSTYLMRERLGTGGDAEMTPQRLWAQVQHEVGVLEACPVQPTDARWPWMCACQPSSQHVPGYVLDGLYESHLRRWRHAFPPEQLLVLRSSELDTDPRVVLARVEAFLGLPPHAYRDADLAVRHNARTVAQAATPTWEPAQTEQLRRWYTTVQTAQA